MRKLINAAIIGADITKEILNTLHNNNIENITWKKMYASNNITGNLSERYAQAEIVTKAEEIINDSNIDLVFVSSHHLAFVKPTIESGKSVRLI